MADQAHLRAICAAHDIDFTRLSDAVAFIEAHMGQDDAAEATSMLLAAISPIHAARRNEEVAARVEPEVEVQAEAEGEAGINEDGAEEAPATEELPADPPKRRRGKNSAKAQ